MLFGHWLLSFNHINRQHALSELSENGGNFVRYQAKVAAKRMLLNMAPSKGCVWLWVQQWCSLTVYCCTACFYFGYRS
ncbi:hypothetical protein Hdeb2414_s0005g00164861 [Helianthus debilis subsp. tardiflorus]